MRGTEKGFVLIATSVCLLALFGIMGLAVDLGRVYITKNEAQTYTDLTALAAAQQLDGTNAGITRSQNQVTGSTMRFNMNTQSFTGTTVEFSTDGAAWAANPASPSNIRYVRLTANVNNINLFFLPAVVTQTVAAVKARSVAGQMAINSYTSEGVGALPYAPFAHDIHDANFGYHQGDEITLRWPNAGGIPNRANQQCHSCCGADQQPQWWNRYVNATGVLTENSWRGYIQDNSASAIREAIEGDHIDYTLTIGQTVNLTNGSKGTEGDSLENRTAQDTNTSAATYSSYLANPGNGRRLGAVPIIDPATAVVIGFAKAFLYSNYDKSGNQSHCAQYVGPAEFQGGSSGGGGIGPKTYNLRLIE